MDMGSKGKQENKRVVGNRSIEWGASFLSKGLALN